MLEIKEYPNAKEVFRFFEEISKIPHGSGNTGKIADYLVSFAKERGFFVLRDASDNVLIRKPAAKGYENRPGVILQGHIDMVAEKTADNPIDMEKEGLSIFRDGDFLRATGTTLGGDDGVAVAYALAILDDPDAQHPALEALFTSDEEIGLLGATAFDCSALQGKIMLNIDSDDEGVFTVGCAGGLRADITLPVHYEKNEEKCFRIALSGLKGGHSGAEIDKGRANANKVGAELLAMLGGVRLVALSGCNADNAIPREFAAMFALSGEDKLIRLAAAMDVITKKYKPTEPELSLVCSEEKTEPQALTAEDSAKLLDLIRDEPSGVVAMSKEMPGLVETSLNLGILKLGEKEASLSFSLRSAKRVEKEKLLARVVALKEGDGAIDDAACAAARENFRAALDNDLNTSLAVTALYDVFKLPTNDATKLSLIAEFDSVLGIGLIEAAAAERKKAEEKAAAAHADVDPELLAYIKEKIEARRAAKAAKNYAEADAIRKELSDKGVTLIDSKEGTDFKIG